jgi:acetyl esterase/lipase
VAPRTAINDVVQRLADLSAQAGLDTAEARRALGVALMEENGPAPRMLFSTSRTLERPDGDLMLRVHVPIAAYQALVVWFVDQLCVLPGIEGIDVVVRKLAERTGAAFVVVDDVMGMRSRDAAVAAAAAAVEESHRDLSKRYGRSVPLVVGGAGTGALLASAVVSARRDSGAAVVALQVLVCPLGDTPELVDESADDDLLRLEDVASFQRQWGAEPSDESSLTGMPPTVVLAGGSDPLAPVARAWVQRLRGAGVQTEYHEHEGEIHDFLCLLALPASERGFQQIVRAVRAVIVRGSL